MLTKSATVYDKPLVYPFIASMPQTMFPIMPEKIS